MRFAIIVNQSMNTADALLRNAPQTPADDIARVFLACLQNGDTQGMALLLHENAVQENPFVPEGFPSRFEGRNGIVGHFEAAFKGRHGLTIDVDRSWSSLDGSRAVVAFRGRSLVAATEAVYSQRYLAVFDLEDGKIVRITEYFNPLVLASAFGGSRSLLQVMGIDRTTA
jgi:hypothetical protein